VKGAIEKILKLLYQDKKHVSGIKKVQGEEKRLLKKKKSQLLMEGTQAKST